jgi:acetylglutamate kinase
MNDLSDFATTSPASAPLHVPLGFSFGQTRCGIKQARPDLGLIVSERPASAAGTFTKNRMRAASCRRNAALLPSSHVQAVIVNSGNANAMTGDQGKLANETMASAVATALGCPPDRVLTASTGVIGVPLPSELIAEKAPAIVASATHDPMAFAAAILTTDTGTKTASTELHIDGVGTVRVLGIAKGSGMIHPDMATTLAFVCTDAAIESADLQRMLDAAIGDTFNAITVDGDSSTNDMTLVLANGTSGVTIEPPLREVFHKALREVLLDLAKQVAADGEGATRLLEVTVSGAPSPATARRIARAVCRSSLVKCSAFSGHPEWGRVAMAIGQAAADLELDLEPSRVTIAAQGIEVYDGTGPSPSANMAELRQRLRRPHLCWDIDLHAGDDRFTAYGCDLTYDYVRINADEAKQIAVSRAGAVTRNLTLAAYSPRLKQQLLVEGLAYVRRFTGLRALIYLPARANVRSGLTASLAKDLELCLDAGLRPVAVVPNEASARLIQDHLDDAGHRSVLLAFDPVSISRELDRGRLSIIVQPSPAPDLIVELALKLGIHKLIALANDQGLRDAHGLVNRLAPETLIAGLDRGRFDASDPDVLVLARHAATRGIPALHILDARVPHAVVGELFTDEGVGTLITRQAIVS